MLIILRYEDKPIQFSKINFTQNFNNRDNDNLNKIKIIKLYSWNT